MKLRCIIFPAHCSHDISGLVCIFAFSSPSVRFILSVLLFYRLQFIVNPSVFKSQEADDPLTSSPGVPCPKLDRGATVGLLQSETFDHEAVRALFSHCSPTKGNGTKETRQTEKQIPVG